MTTKFFAFPGFSRVAMMLFAAIAFSLYSCQPEGETLADEDEEIATQEAEAEATYDDVEAYSFEALELTDFSVNRRTIAAAQRLIDSTCATVTHDQINKTITLDFGTGCTGPDGKVRAGIILITYTQRLYIPGAVVSISLDSFYVDGNHVEGSKTITNVSANLASPISLNAVLTGGKVTWTDGTFATREYNRTSTWIRAANPVNDQLEVDGVATGTRRNGNAYTATITNTLVFRRLCSIQGIRMPAEGTVLIQRSNRPDLTVDFGNGQCDTEITLSMNGQSQTVTL